MLAPFALVKNLDAEKDDVDNDDSYFVTTLQNGERMATEWNPELRLVMPLCSLPLVFLYPALTLPEHTHKEAKY